MASMNAWLQVVVSLLGVAGVMVAVMRWGMRGFEARIGAVVRAETAPQFARIDAWFESVNHRLGALERDMAIVNHRLGALEGDMSIVKQRLIGLT